LDDVDRQAFMESLEAIFVRDGVLLHAFCLMDNHFHLLIETTGKPLNRVMRSLLTACARNFNRRHGRVGHLFQGRYKASLCEKESYRLELLRYIHMNPVRAGLVDRPEDWRWSSHRAYLGLVAVPALTTRPTLEEFGPSVDRARAALARFVQAAADPHGKEAMEKAQGDYSSAIRDGAVLGSGLFHGTARRVKRKPGRRAEDAVKGGRRRIDDLLKSVSRERKISLNELKGSTRRADAVEARMDLLLKALGDGWTSAAVARALGRSRSWASQLMTRRTLEVGGKS
jgi:REP element-mobilizing transposase RayT